jgi:PadR family transcriptional regulator, regulatory protein AphA
MSTTSTRYALLGLLTMAPASGASGYDLRRWAESSIGHFWRESYGQIYPVLKQLLRDGLVTANEGAGSGKREKTLYAITAAGRKELSQWLQKPARLQPPRNEGLLKLFFGPEAATGANAARVRHLQQFHRGLLARYQAVEREINEQHASHPGLPYWLMTLDYGQRNSQMVVDWCDATLRKLERPSQSGKQRKGKRSA